MGSEVNVKFFDKAIGQEEGVDCLFNLALSGSMVSLEGLIAERVLAEFEALKKEVKFGSINLVKVSEYEAKLNQTKELSYSKYSDDPMARYYISRAIKAFEANRFFVIVNGVQAENLDDKIVLLDNSEVEFFQLPALQGG